MSDASETLDLSMTPEGDPICLVNGSEELRDLEALRARAPNVTPEALAEVINEFAQGRAFRLIRDPVRFEADYRAQIAREDPQAIWSQNTVRLRDFGIPDFAEIAAPARTDTTVVFFVADRYSGVPYRVEAALTPGAPAPSYRPLALTPMPGPNPAVPPEVTAAALGPAVEPEPQVEPLPPRE